MFQSISYSCKKFHKITILLMWSLQKLACICERKMLTKNNSKTEHYNCDPSKTGKYIRANEQ
ncbi:hypothetical protein V1477_019833 [Vespula maculifrons]|uniref:Uncharacterized protein n=1 Tax=Vespula maculifrons TaxID=7453 RepID=A0ABD2AK74_VESMC